jgi:chromatin segregation and condensation protein Rec8/ScpA/Scc1 (kleisin family)
MSDNRFTVPFPKDSPDLKIPKSVFSQGPDFGKIRGIDDVKPKTHATSIPFRSDKMAFGESKEKDEMLRKKLLAKMKQVKEVKESKEIHPSQRLTTAELTKKKASHSSDSRSSSQASSRSDVLEGDSLRLPLISDSPRRSVNSDIKRQVENQFYAKSEHDLTSLLTARLNDVEKTVKAQRAELAARVPYSDYYFFLFCFLPHTLIIMIMIIMIIIIYS